MSAKDTEFYPTPTPLAALLVERLMWQVPNDMFVKQDDSGDAVPVSILEPSAGDGSFVWPLSGLDHAEVTAIEPFEDEPENLPVNVEWGKMSLEELHEALEGERPFDIACGNPPFSLAEAHLRLLFKMIRKGGHVGFLLRSGFLSSKKRAKFFAAYPPKHVYILSSRPSFVWSWQCKIKPDPEAKKHKIGCAHKWMDTPGVEHEKCPECGETRTLTVSKTDTYDYCFVVWQPDMPPEKGTTMSWINSFVNEDEEE